MRGSPGRQDVLEPIAWETMRGTPTTPESLTCVGACEADSDTAVLDRAGTRQKADQIDPLVPQPCPQCHTVGGPESRFCSTCGQALTPEAAAEIADAKRKLWSDQDMMTELSADIRERNEREAEAATPPPISQSQSPSAPAA